MRHFLFIFLFIFTAAELLSQNCHKIKIEKNKKNFPNKNFYFDEVIDARTDSSSIGQVYTGQLNFKNCADLKPKVKFAIKIFLQRTFPNTNAPKYLVKINELFIDELVIKNKNDKAKALINLEFYRQDKNALVFITNSIHQIEEEFPDVTYSHGNRIKRLLLICVADLESRLKTDSTSFTLTTTRSELLNKKFVSNDSANVFVKPVLTERYKTNISIFGYQGFVTLGAGVKLNPYFFLKKIPKFAVGPSIYWAYFAFNKDFNPPSNVVSVKYFLGNVGVGFFYRLNKFFGVTADLSILAGSESITSTYTDVAFVGTDPIYGNVYYVSQKLRTNNQAVFGFQAEQGFLFMGKNKTGLNIGLSIFERALSGTLYDSDAGVKINLGLNF